MENFEASILMKTICSNQQFSEFQENFIESGPQLHVVLRIR